MKTAKEWLEEKVPFTSTWTEPTSLTRLELLGRLVSKNGGRIEVGSWGIVSSDGPFGRGLEQEEVLVLIEFKGFLSGLQETNVDLMMEIVTEIGKFVMDAEKSQVSEPE